MGGLSGGRGSPLGDISDLERLVDKELQRVVPSERRNVFISFAEEDQNEVNLIRAQSANDLSEIEFRDWSVKTPYNSQNAEYIRARIHERIEHCSVTVVFISKATTKSDWVRWEVETSLKLGKKVIAVHKGSRAPSKLPSVITKNQVKVIPWSDLARNLKNPK